MISRSAGQFVDCSARPATPSRRTARREFLDAELEGRTALALVDVKMEGMTGFDLQEELAARHSAIPIIFIISFDDAATRERIRRTRWECLVKPFDEQALLGSVGRVRKPV